MKFIAVICFLITIAINAFSQSDSISLLSCRTWGSPDWTQLNHHYEVMQLKRTGATIREYDANIDRISPNDSDVYGDDVFLRWILTDTTIIYDVKVSDGDGTLLYAASSNKCGIYIPFSTLQKQYSVNQLRVDVERSERGSYRWGLNFIIGKIQSPQRDVIQEDLNKVLTNVASEEKLITAVDYFVKKRRYADALYLLERAGQNESGNSELTKKYWLTVNEMFIEKMRK
jgi:hypothetical protein